GYAFPFSDNRPGHGPINLRPELIEGLSLAYSAPVEGQAVFDAMLGLLSASTYTLRFAEDLEDVFPHIPFPTSKGVFDRAAAVGKSIREIETFERVPDPLYLTSAIARIETTPRGKLAAISPGNWDAGDLILCDDGTGKVSGIPASVWDFAVSGYRVLQKWLAGREGISVDDAFIRELRDITGRINELIHLFNEADLVLQEALNHTLTRRELGLE
ncbi:MAG TPA: type ISP restriction/modification enzyme, partial [Chthoniobacterales bacterium]|nr:type ISP restriction/modification enzyme [Chthoniobacterales bacterium]